VLTGDLAFICCLLFDLVFLFDISLYAGFHGDSSFLFDSYNQPVRSAYQPPARSTFHSERTSHQQPAATSQQYSSLRTNQHQPSATSQPNRLNDSAHFFFDFFIIITCLYNSRIRMNR
jgi:hypothetical protein